MNLRQSGAVLMVLLTACGSASRAPRQAWDDREAGPNASRYGLSIISPQRVQAEPVELDDDDFREALTKLAREARPTPLPQEAARRLFSRDSDGGLPAHLRSGPVVRMAPLDVAGRALESETVLTREYLRWCARTQSGGDCLRLLVDGPTVRGDDRYALALAISLGSVLEETKHALKGMVEPSAVLSMLVWTAAVYLLLWALPDRSPRGSQPG